MAGSRFIGLPTARANAAATARAAMAERRWPETVGPLEWGVGNRRNQRHRRAEGNAVRAAYVLETGCCRAASGGLPGADRCVVPRNGEFASDHASGQLRSGTMKPGFFSRRCSRSAYIDVWDCRLYKQRLVELL